MRAKARLLLCAFSIVAVYACTSGDEFATNDDGSRTPGKGGSAGTSAGSAGSGGAGSAGSGGAGNGGGISIDEGKLTALQLEPPSLAIEVINGQSSPQTVTAKALFDDGSSKSVSATWSFDQGDIGNVNNGGVFTAFGNKGGKGKLTAQYQDQSASAEVTIKLRLSSSSEGVSQEDKDAFSAPTDAPSGELLYPYDNTVFARGLVAPELMWDGAAPGDLYRITVDDAYVSLEAYAKLDEGRWSFPKEWWDSLAFSSEGAPFSYSIARKPADGPAMQPMTRSMIIAPGNLRGTIYYWAVNLGQIVKLNPGADTPVPAFDPGPYDQLGDPPPVSSYGGQNPPWDNQGSGKRCVACHTVSRDGSTLAALFSACDTSGPGTCYRPWGAVDTASEAITTMSPYGPGDAMFSALSPNGSHLVTDTQDFRLRLADPKTGQNIPSALDSLNPDGFGPEGSQVAHPQFSVDGKKLAFVSGVNGGSPIEFSRSDLAIVDADLSAEPYFSNIKHLQVGGSDAIGFPSFTPDGQWVIYQRGTFSRASYGAPLQTGFNDLFMTDVAGSGVEIKLSAANGEGLLPLKDARRNYQPRVNPVAVGGYFWVVFVSPRDYGSRMRAASDATLENRKQLWVAAIDANPQPGKDPSHPAFRLGGQALETINMDGYWALEPCKQQGSSCGDGYECCSGFCRDQGDGSFACVPPPENQCSQLGEACQTSADCCPGTVTAQCIGGFCAQPVVN